MANKEILLVIEAVSNEKQVPRDLIFSAIESALATAIKKSYLHDEEQDVEIRVHIDRRTGDYESFRVWKIIPDEQPFENPDAEISLSEAKKSDPQAVIDGVIEQKLSSAELGGRISAQVAKQVIIQKVREAERLKIVDAYRAKIGEIVSGTVKRVTHEAIWVDLGQNMEALLRREDMLPRENFRIGDIVRACLIEVRPNLRGGQVILSRVHPEMLRKLFFLEVPEVSEELIEIKSVARDPGVRAKIAVKTNDGRIDPVGSCVGVRGSRVQAVSEELGGERIDIILWSDNPAHMVINAMVPAEIESIVVDEESHSMDLIVAQENLSQAIGRNGQNVRLASQLTGWQLNVMSASAAKAKDEAEHGRLSTLFMSQLQADEDVASALIEAGLSNLEEVAYLPAKELLGIEGFDEELVAALQENAKAALENKINLPQDQPKSAPALSDLQGVTPELATAFAEKGLHTQEDLAEQTVDDIVGIGGLDKNQAAALIMAAREIWFKS